MPVQYLYMYHVVGCSDCSALRIVEGRPDRSSCGRCGSSAAFSSLKKFVSTESADHAREVRASMLANRQGEAEAFARVEAFSELTDAVADGVVDDDEFLEASGLDADAANAAGERATSGRASTSGQSKREVVLEALAELDAPSEDDVVGYASERGVERSFVERALEKLRRSGEVTRANGTYRRL
jgi:hypothetical protein